MIVTTFPAKSTVIITAEVNTYADLPTANTNAGKIYIVKTASGTWVLGTKKNPGLYKSNGVEWIYLGNTVVVDDTTASDSTVYSSSKVNTLVGGRISVAEKGIANGVATLGDGGKIPVSQVDWQYIVDQNILEIEGMFKEAHSTMYTEYVYNDGAIAEVIVRADNVTGPIVFTKTFVYAGGNVSEVVLVDYQTGYQVTTGFIYNAGTLVSKTKTLEMT